MGGAEGAAAAAAAIAQAIKASGAIVRVPPEDFAQIVARGKAPLVVISAGGFFRKDHQYLSSYKGLAFYARSREPIQLPGDAEVVLADKIWVPG